MTYFGDTMDNGPKIILWILGMTVFFAPRSAAQNEWLATFNYQTQAVNRLGNIPVVDQIAGNGAYDANHQRYFFQGNGTGALPFNLYTVDAITGAVIYQPVSPNTGDPTDQLAGLQYDNVTDTLYSLLDISVQGWYFSWVDPATGLAHIRGGMTGITGFVASAYDTKDHWYFVNGTGALGPALFVIDARTGNVLYHSASASMSGMNDLNYDNVTGRLYGIYQHFSLANDQFDSIAPSTGIAYLIANVPDYSIPDIFTTCIDENAGKFIYVGNDAGSSPCHTEHLLVLDIATGNVSSNSVYPYADNASSATSENVIGYNFDNRRSVLYALNWHVPGTQAPNSATITATANPICRGAPVLFTAHAGQGIVAPTYQWTLNSNKVGTDEATYSSSGLFDGDTIRCVVISNPVCNLPDTVISDSIVMKVMDSTQSSVTIAASLTTICAGTPVVFTATPVNGGGIPMYEWEVNGHDAGAQGDHFTDAALNNGDLLSCILTSSLVCTRPVGSANTIPMTVNPLPEVVFKPDTLVVRRGKSVRLDPVISGAIASYQWMPAAGLDHPSSADPIAAPTDNTIYELSLTGSDGCPGSGKLTVLVYDSLQMPNAFTPNGDGRNDVFRIPPTLSEIVLSLYVFDRWGKHVFSGRGNGAGWDGTAGNQPQPTGTYVWEIEYVNLLTGKTVMARGTVELIR
jgi:gliding motility-associated-like protein